MSIVSSCLLTLLLLQSGGARVELEVVMDGGGPLGEQQAWLRLLAEVKADGLRMRSAESSDRVGVTKTGGRAVTTYKVTCYLSADNQLETPGGRFRKSEMARLKAWVDSVRSGGLERAADDREKMAFGLKADELVRLHEQMGAATGIKTQGVPVTDVIRAIRRTTAIQISVHSSASVAIKTEMNVKEEFGQLSCGTTLAAIIRPLGLVAVPIKTGGREIKIQLMDSRVADEHWPIGWPLEVAPREVAPKLFEFLEVDIEDYKLDETLAAIQEKTAVPFIYDQNAMALNDIELSDVRVSVRPGRTYYYMIIRRIVSQSKPAMKPELRLDEAGNPFIWLTTYK